MSLVLSHPETSAECPSSVSANSSKDSSFYDTSEIPSAGFDGPESREYIEMKQAEVKAGGATAFTCHPSVYKGVQGLPELRNADESVSNNLANLDLGLADTCSILPISTSAESSLYTPVQGTKCTAEPQLQATEADIKSAMSGLVLAVMSKISNAPVRDLRPSTEQTIVVLDPALIPASRSTDLAVTSCATLYGYSDCSSSSVTGAHRSTFGDGSLGVAPTQVMLVL